MLSVDLHIHSTYSDGLLSPEQVADKAAEMGIDVISVTDHDSMGAYHKSRIMLLKNITVIPGVEISCHMDGNEYHVLGYCIDPFDPPLMNALKNIRESRLKWAAGILGSSSALISKGKTPMRIDVLHSLVRSGKAADYRDASGILRSFGTGFTRLTVKKASALITAAGGIPVLAHPGLYGKDTDVLLSKMRSASLRGIETYYPYHMRCPSRFPSKNDSDRYCSSVNTLSEKYGLAATSGSDAHGSDLFSHNIKKTALPGCDFKR